MLSATWGARSRQRRPSCRFSVVCCFASFHVFLKLAICSFLLQMWLLVLLFLPLDFISLCTMPKSLFFSVGLFLGAFRRRQIEPTLFRFYYDRGDIPLSIDHTASGPPVAAIFLALSLHLCCPGYLPLLSKLVVHSVFLFVPLALFAPAVLLVASVSAASLPLLLCLLCLVSPFSLLLFFSFFLT